VTQRIDKRLQRKQRLLVTAPIEHDRAVVVRAQRTLRRQPRLPDPRLAAQQHELTSATRRLREDVVQRRQIRGAAD
jgi:hypothetical protein